MNIDITTVRYWGLLLIPVFPNMNGQRAGTAFSESMPKRESLLGSGRRIRR
ncbi:hypothetical protein [Sphingomonas sp. Leaf28]|uniref:hypothetical protein n=1 Tax=Sphingomonas sp. Leaf28 TaxID=1735695 RepID=UPI000A7BFD5B|nr:hypothetical protein [Sphingomonas sp. Leaf28]